MHLRACALAISAVSLIVALSPASADLGGDPQAGKTKAAACAGCHGAEGNGGADPSWPKLAGQVPEYLVNQLKRFKSGARKNPIMNGMAAPLSQQDIRDIAAYFAAQKLKLGAAKNKELALKGQRIYRGGIIETGVPACMSCHGPSGHGIPPHFPRLYAQNTAYTKKQLLDFRDGRRVSADGIMPRIATRLTEPQVEALSEYLSGLH
jgi:cytochrome c553